MEISPLFSVKTAERQTAAIQFFAVCRELHSQVLRLLSELYEPQIPSYLRTLGTNPL